MKILKKEWFIWKFWKKGGGGNEIHAPCACENEQKKKPEFIQKHS
jgi:hypothetical protein